MPGDAAALTTTPEGWTRSVRVFARVEVHRDSAAVLDAWAELEASAPCSVYQSRAWLLPWIATLGAEAGIAPLFVLARGEDERAVALLCLGLSRRGPLRIATWLGGSDANFNMPLLRPGLAWSKAEVRRLLGVAAEACGRDRPALFILANQPRQWMGRDNPFALLPHQPSPSFAFGARLMRDPDAFLASKLSKESRKKLRKKEARLATLGPVTHEIATDVATQREMIDTFLAQKLARFRAQRISSNFESRMMRAFLEIGSRPTGASIELHVLRVGMRIVAVYGGGAHNGQWSGMFNSFDADAEIAKASPGDLLLQRIIVKACGDGLRRFDLGIGEARYKTALCDEPIALFDAIVPVSVIGAIVARLVSLRQTAKRAIKANPRLYGLARWARTLRV